MRKEKQTTVGDTEGFHGSEPEAQKCSKMAHSAKWEGLHNKKLYRGTDSPTASLCFLKW